MNHAEREMYFAYDTTQTGSRLNLAMSLQRWVYNVILPHVAISPDSPNWNQLLSFTYSIFFKDYDSFKNLFHNLNIMI